MLLVRKIFCATTILLILFACFGGGGASYEFNSAKTYARIDKDLKAAEQWGLKAMEVQPENSLIPYFLATEVYRPMKKQAKVGEMFLEALNRTENSPLDRPFKVGDEYINTVHDAVLHEAFLLYNDATELYNKGKSNKAFPKFELSMALNPTILQNYIALADISFENGDIDSAMSYLDRGAEINSNNDLKIRKAKFARAKKNYSLALSTLEEIKTEEKELQLIINREIFIIHLEQEDYMSSISLGAILVEDMFNTLGVDDLVLSETCYNVAISNRIVGYELYNGVLETINSGTEDKDELMEAIENGKKSIGYFKTAKERFYDASSFNPDDTKSSEYAKDLNKIIKQLKKLFIPSLTETLNK